MEAVQIGVAAGLLLTAVTSFSCRPRGLYHCFGYGTIPPTPGGQFKTEVPQTNRDPYGSNDSS